MRCHRWRHGLVWMIALKKYVVGKQMRVRKRLGLGECIEIDVSVFYLDMTADEGHCKEPPAVKRAVCEG